MAFAVMLVLVMHHTCNLSPLLRAEPTPARLKVPSRLPSKQTEAADGDDRRETEDFRRRRGANPDSPREGANALDSAIEQFVPKACDKVIVRKHPTIAELIAANKGADMGLHGGEWSACTHLKIYGLNFASNFVRGLAHGLKPASVLEFGCGLGTTSDFLARFVPGGARVVCVEPEPMLGEVYGAGQSHLPQHRFPARPVQLAMMSFAPEARQCADKLFTQEMGFELVCSFEVAEHVPAQFHPELVRRIAAATSKYLVFSAARPDQGGTGHLHESSHLDDWWIKEFTSVDRGAAGKLVFLPLLSKILRIAAYPDRDYDLAGNVIAFGVPGTPDIPKLPSIVQDCDLYPTHTQLHMLCKTNKTAAEYIAWRAARATERAAEERALWPELVHQVKLIKNGTIKCSTGAGK